VRKFDCCDIFCLIYFVRITIAQLIYTGKDVRGYVFPSYLRYIGPGTERNMQFVGEDVIGLAIWETRCGKFRHDLIVYSVKSGSCCRVAHDDNNVQNGCQAFLSHRCCDLEHEISDELQKTAMRYASVCIAVLLKLIVYP